MLDRLLKFYQRTNLTVVKIELDETIATERMLERGRADDVPELIKQRLESYRAKTVPMVEYYKQQPDVNLITVDGNHPVAEVSGLIKQNLNL